MTVARRLALSVLLVTLTLTVTACTAAPQTPVSPDMPPAALNAPASPDLTPGTRTVTVHADSALGKFYRFWSVANVNNPHTLLTEGLKKVLECSPHVSEINCVYLLGGRWPGENVWFKGVNADGSLRTDFAAALRPPGPVGRQAQEVEQQAARLAVQGELPSEPRLAGGYFVPPTIFADVDNTASQITNSTIVAPRWGCLNTRRITGSACRNDRAKVERRWSESRRLYRKFASVMASSSLARPKPSSMPSTISRPSENTSSKAPWKSGKSSMRRSRTNTNMPCTAMKMP